MGTIISTDTRRISFENTFAIAPALAMQKATDIDDVSIHENFLEESEEQIMFKECKDEGDGDYWNNRIDKLKKEHQIINSIMETEYDKMIQKTTAQYRIPEISQEKKIQQLKPCFELQSKILECYRENPRQPLNCSSAIKAFSDCVNSFKYQKNI